MSRFRLLDYLVQSGMKISAVVAVSQGLDFVVRGRLELDEFVDSLFGHVYCSVVVYMVEYI